jgi:hypothetical protein
MNSIPLFRFVNKQINNLIKINNLNKIKNLTKQIKEPIAPEPYQCCGDGCKNCVWITYFEELEIYNKIKKTLSTKNI